MKRNDACEFALLLLLALPCISVSAHAAERQAVPPFIARGLPGPFQAALNPLAGDWSVAKEIYIAIGTPEKPARSKNMVAHRRWAGGGRHLVDTTEGEIGDASYYRLGVLGFSNIDHRYEWDTFDGLNANAMLYLSPPLQNPGDKIVLNGVFTDQGLMGEEWAGKQILMRTVISIADADHHVIDLYFQAPGEKEILIDHSTYTRIPRQY